MRRYFYSLMTDRRNDALSAFLKLGLLLLAELYQMLLTGYHLLWQGRVLKPKKIPLTVISVGNITVGGTGKTPFVKWLVSRLLVKGRKVAILLRGYKELAPGLSDEALELQRSFPEVPVWVGKNRVELAEKALSSQRDTVILDDGFQYRWLARDLDIVLIDAANPFGNGNVIPRGILREKPFSLRRADVLVMTRIDSDAEKLESLEHSLKGYAPHAPILFSSHRIRRFYEAKTKEEISLPSICSEKVIPFCGIGNPEGFARLLREAGLSTVQTFFFMDHHRYQKKDLEKIDRAAESLGATSLLTTEKDLERLEILRLRPSTRLVGVEMELSFTRGEHELLQRLDTLFSR